MHLCKGFFFFFFKHWISCHGFCVDILYFWLYFFVHPKLSLDNYTICKRMLQPKQNTIEISILTIVVRHVTCLNPLHCTICKWGAQRAPALPNDTSVETFLHAFWSIVFHVLGDKGVALKQCKDTNDCLKRLTYCRALEPGNHLCHFKLWNIILRAQGLKKSFWVSVNERSLLRGSWPENTYVFNNGSNSRAACRQIRYWRGVFCFSNLFIYLTMKCKWWKQANSEKGKHRRLFWLLRFDK